MQFVFDHYHGLAGLGLWGYVAVTLLVMHVTLLGITLYYHRDQAHRAIDLHPALRHFFRFWLWMTTGANTKEWVAVHRKHHAFCEKEGDPHSPKVFGLRTVLLRGAELYRAEAADPATIEKYAKGTPDDWMQRNVYERYSNSGIALLAVTDIVLFGVPGIILLSIQLITMPLLAAGVINGLGHAKGYRNFETDDASTNLWPIAFFVAGEELHNNHHAFPSSAKFSLRRGEIDLGWLHIKLLAALGLVEVRRVAPVPELASVPGTLDLAALRAIIINRMHVLRHYSQSVTLPVLRAELERVGENAGAVCRRARRFLSRSPNMLDASSRQRLDELMSKHPSFKTVLEFRAELKTLWSGAHRSNEHLLADVKAWCTKAEASGIQKLQDFAVYLRSFAQAQALPA
ncbi:MAG: fatty acid desaturase [Gammaproteobacteria bacterium]|nr:fatty acid desaturase [Gammaproteobacteria bacterium]MDH3506748.1 fatty acid desaturase [Gammaproteobacteria bacterium]